MKYLPLPLLFLFTFSQLPAQPLTTPDELLDQAIAAKQFAGVTAGIAVGDEIKWVGSAGYCNQDQQTACTDTTLNRIASITKVITAVAALQLHEKNLLDLDLPITHYLPEYPVKTASKITTRQLLHQTSGIGAYASAKEAETTKEYADLAAACKVFQDRDLLFEPGSKYQYSTYGYVLLGRVIEAASGQPYGEYLQENIFNKAGMTHSGIEKFGVNYPNKSAFFYRNKKGKIKDATPNNLSNRIPGGGLYSNVPDMLKFGQALLNGTLVSDSTLALMQTYPDVDRGENNPYGMGLFLYGDNPEFGPVIGHTGEQTGVAGQLMLLPEKGIVIIVLSNTSLALRDAFQLAVNLFPIAEGE